MVFSRIDFGKKHLSAEGRGGSREGGLPHPGKRYGGVAQLGEHLLCKQGVRSSILLISTNSTLKTE